MSNKKDKLEILPLLKREVYAVSHYFDYEPEKEVEIEGYPGYTELKDEIHASDGNLNHFWAATCPHCKEDINRENTEAIDPELADEIEQDICKCKRCSGLIDTRKSEIIKLTQTRAGPITLDQWFVYSLRHYQKKSYKLIAKIKQTSESNVRDLYMKAKRKIDRYSNAQKENDRKELSVLYNELERDTSKSSLNFKDYSQEDVLLLGKYKGMGSIDILLGEVKFEKYHNIYPKGDVALRYRLSKEKNPVESRDLDILFVYTYKKGWQGFPLTNVMEEGE